MSPIFAVAADIKKAHRRVLHKSSEWGLLGCRDNQEEGQVWLNRVGTFGIGSIAYWWQRLASGLGRLSLRLVEDSWVFVLIFADDLQIASAGRHKFRTIWKILLIWMMCGAPFSWGKFRGGLALEWIGYSVSYSRSEIGVSEKRTAWTL